jgi:hypothetical protein
MNSRKIKLSENGNSDLLLCHSKYLKSENISDQQNQSMLGQRTRFLALHRYIDNLSCNELKSALEKVKAKFIRELEQYPNDSFIDTKILEDVIHHEIMIRDDYDVSQIENILKSYLCNVHLAEQFLDVTSDHMISEIA